jgi:ATP-dependent DNA helicase RecG
MEDAELRKTFEQLLALPAENEWLEFREAKTSINFEEMGQYFSALSNEANLKSRPCGWLILGVRDKDRQIIGTRYRTARSELDKLKHEIANHTINRITFVEIHELYVTGRRAIMFQIPPAPKGVPTTWKGHFYGREGESIGPLTLQEIDQIRNQGKTPDWSA